MRFLCTKIDPFLDTVLSKKALMRMMRAVVLCKRGRASATRNDHARRRVEATRWSSLPGVRQCLIFCFARIGGRAFAQLRDRRWQTHPTKRGAKLKPMPSPIELQIDCVSQSSAFSCAAVAQTHELCRQRQCQKSHDSAEPNQLECGRAPATTTLQATTPETKCKYIVQSHQRWSCANYSHNASDNTGN